MFYSDTCLVEKKVFSGIFFYFPFVQTVGSCSFSACAKEQNVCAKCCSGADKIIGRFVVSYCYSCLSKFIDLSIVDIDLCGINRMAASIYMKII